MVLIANLDGVFWILLFVAALLIAIVPHINVCEDSKCQQVQTYLQTYTFAKKNSTTPFLTMNFDNAREFCLEENKILPQPKSSLEEMELIREFNSVNLLNQCKMFYLGYKQTDMRYESLNRNSIWPSLSINLSVSQPSLDRDCLEFTFQPIRNISVKRCSEVTSTCYYYLHDKNCLNSPPKCAKFGIFNKEIDILTAFEAIKENDRGAIGIAAVDINYYPVSSLLSQTVLQQNTCVALAVRYRFRYTTRYGSLMPYRSIRFMGYDAETDCLVVKLGNKTTVRAKSCDEDACVMCAARRLNFDNNRISLI